MPTGLFTHKDCLAHDTGAGHPESRSRLEAVQAVLTAPAFAALRLYEAPLATHAQIARVHDAEYVERVLASVPVAGYMALDADTRLSPGSGMAALRAAGAVVAAVAAVMTGEVGNAFCAIRPPGHHAERDRAMGFCVFNNIAIGAAAARAEYNVARVAVIDFDVHHGNGTQHMFASDPAFFYASTHQSPLYPGTGGRDERGVGNIVNVPLPPDSGSAVFRAALEAEIIPALERFRPDLLMISAGFDAHRDDPLASLQLDETDYAWVTQRLMAVADVCCQGRLVSVLEGGYDLEALAASVARHVKALMNG